MPCRPLRAAACWNWFGEDADGDSSGCSQGGIIGSLKTQNPFLKHKFSICWNSAKFARHLTYLNCWLALFFGYTFSLCRVWQLTMSAGHWCSWSWVHSSTPASRWGNSAFRRSKEFRRVVKIMCDVTPKATGLDMVEANMTLKRANLSLRLSKCEWKKWFRGTMVLKHDSSEWAEFRGTLAQIKHS